MAPSSDDIVTLLESGLNVGVVGPALSGRTRLLDEVADRLKEHERHVVRVAGIGALVDRPLGALALVDLGDGGPTPTTPGDLARRLALTVGSRPAALVLDDVDDLDIASVGALHAVLLRRRVPVVVSRRAGSDDAPGVRHLLSALPLSVAVEIGPVPFDEIHHIVHDALGGPVDAASVASIAVLAGRLPGLAVALVAVARAEGALVEREGVWRSVGTISGPGLAGALSSIIRDLDSDDRDGLVTLALAGRIAIGVAERLIGGESFPRLERLGLLTLSRDGGADSVAVVPPALGEYLVRSCGPLRRTRLERRIAQHRTQPFMPLVSNRAGVEDAIANKRIADHWETERLSLLQSWRADAGVSVALPLLVATLVCPPSSPTPEEIRDGTDLASGDPSDVALFECWYALHLAVHERSLTEAIAHLEDCAGRRPGDAALFLATRTHLEAMFDAVPGPDVTDALAATGPGRAISGVVRIERELYAGDPVAAGRLLEVEDPPDSIGRSTYAVAPGLIRILEGDVAGAAQWALDHVASARSAMDPGAMQAYAYVAALGLALAGRFAQLDVLVASSLTMTARSAQEEHYRSGVLDLAAIGAAWQGQRSYSRRLTLQARALDHRPGPLPAMISGAVLAFTRDTDPDPLGDDASAQIWRIAEDRLSHGYLFAGVLAAVASLERGPDAGRAARLRSALEGVRSPLLAGLGRYAVAVGTGDAEELTGSSAELADLGVFTYAVRAVVSRAVLERTAGSPQAALATIRRAWELSEAFDGPRLGMFQPYVTALDLSAREVEIVEMISTGMTAAEAASALSISPRTVESHLFAAYRKTGLDNREDLTVAVNTWLAPQMA